MREGLIWPSLMLFRLLRSVIPVFLFIALFGQTLSHSAGSCWWRNNDRLAWGPVCRYRNTLFGAGLQSVDNAQDFINVPTQVERIVDQSANYPLIVDKEDRADCRRSGCAWRNHAIKTCDFLVEIGNDGKRDLNPEVLFNICLPRKV